MKIKDSLVTSLKISFVALIFNAQAAGINNSEAYDDAQLLGSCAGMLEFNSQIQAAQGNPASAEDLHQKANGWRIATMGALSEAGWKDENITSTADSIYNGALTHWYSAAERKDPNIGRELNETIDKCLEINDKQEKYRKAIKLEKLSKQYEHHSSHSSVPSKATLRLHVSDSFLTARPNTRDIVMATQ